MSDELPRLRRGVGVIYVVAGLLHATLMVYAALYSLGQLHVLISARLWSEMYFGHFLFMLLGGFLYLAFSFRQTRTFYFEALIDFLVGIAAFFVIMSGVAVLLVRQLIHPWLSLSISAFLLVYGLGLTQGRVCGFGPKPRPLP